MIHKIQVCSENMRSEVLSVILGHVLSAYCLQTNELLCLLMSMPEEQSVPPTPEHWRMSYKMQLCTSVTSLCLCYIEVGSKFKALREMK